MTEYQRGYAEGMAAGRAEAVKVVVGYVEYHQDGPDECCTKAQLLTAQRILGDLKAMDGKPDPCPECARKETTLKQIRKLLYLLEHPGREPMDEYPECTRAYEDLEAALAAEEKEP